MRWTVQARRGGVAGARDSGLAQGPGPVGETTCVFRDSAFVGDVAKTNLAKTLEQHGITNVRSV